MILQMEILYIGYVAHYEYAVWIGISRPAQTRYPYTVVGREEVKEISQKSQDSNWLRLEVLIRIWEVLGSILDPDTGCSDLDDRSFAESLKQNI
jgi:hypothetical protein